MSKQIEEDFSVKINGNNFLIRARNYNEHLFSVNGNERVALTPSHMIILGQFMIETANKINKDPDFKK